MSQWNKLINQVLALDINLRYEDLSKALTRIGYTAKQPRGGSSHVTFRKDGYMPVTLLKKPQMDKVYVELVKTAVLKYLSEEASKNEES